MQNEVMLVMSLLVIYTTVLVFYKLLGRSGLYVWTTIATIAANIEVLILVDAFGLEQTLGNILFASTFLITDILSETQGREYANKAVKVGVMTNLAFIVISQSWFCYLPSANDWASESIRTVFANTPRFMIVALLVYAITQAFDVWFYHAIWAKTTKVFGDSKKGLWIRNNGSTMVSQLLNTVLYTLGAFWGIYETGTLMQIMFATYIIYFVTSLVDTPVVYLARRMHDKAVK